MERVIVVGTTGSGKSKVSRALSQKLSLPCIQLDELFWEPGWTEPRNDIFLKKVEAATAGRSWIVDGNYGRTNHLTWPQADTVIWIDLPLWLTFYQNLSRSLKRALSEEELWPGTGNKESLSKLFSKDSILLWLLKTYSLNREKYSQRMNDPEFSHINFIHLRSRNELKKFIAALPPLSF